MFWTRTASRKKKGHTLAFTYTPNSFIYWLIVSLWYSFSPLHRLVKRYHLKMKMPATKLKSALLRELKSSSLLLVKLRSNWTKKSMWPGGYQNRFSFDPKEFGSLACSEKKTLALDPLRKDVKKEKIVFPFVLIVVMVSFFSVTVILYFLTRVKQH